MTEAEVKAAIEATTPGANVYVEWERPLDLRAAYKGFPLFKRTKMLLRLGVQYDNIDEVKQGRADGSLPAENAGLKGKVWVQYPTLKRSVKSGQLLLSVKVAKVFGNKVKTAKTTYIVREAGKETVYKRDEGLAQFEHMMFSKDLKRGEMPPTFDLKVENILSINEHQAEAQGEAEAEGEAI